VTVFLDTAIIMYAAGAQHPHKQPCADILSRVGAGELNAVISAEVIQELAHRFVHAGKSSRASELTRNALDLFAPVIPITQSVVARLPGLIDRYRALEARDLIHVATCLEERIEVIVSPDRAFDAVHELKRIDPSDADALRRHGA